MGLKPVTESLQVEIVTDDLRNSLWNILYDIYFQHFWFLLTSSQEDLNKNPGYTLCKSLWLDHFKYPIDEFRSLGFSGNVTTQIKRYFLNCPWNEVYDFIEFTAENTHDLEIRQCFIDSCNKIFERENSAYRFINDIIVSIIDTNEVNEIENAFNILPEVDSHLSTALDLFANRESPDYRNSIKESISAVEAMCRVISKDKNATLGDALKLIEKQGKIEMGTPLKAAFLKLYGWSSSSEGIRHALQDQPNLTLEEARFMLITCSAFINYLKGKCVKAGVSLSQKGD